MMIPVDDVATESRESQRVEGHSLEAREPCVVGGGLVVMSAL